MSDIELRTVHFGEPVNVAVKKREDGSAKPRALIAGVPASDVIQLIGNMDFYHRNQLDHKRVDCATEVVDAINSGRVELGIVSEVPHPLQEGIGVILTAQGENSAVSLLGRVSSPINPKGLE